MGLEAGPFFYIGPPASPKPWVRRLERFLYIARPKPKKPGTKKPAFITGPKPKCQNPCTCGFEDVDGCGWVWFWMVVHGCGCGWFTVLKAQ